MSRRAASVEMAWVSIRLDKGGLKANPWSEESSDSSDESLSSVMYEAISDSMSSILKEPSHPWFANVNIELSTK